MEEKIKKAVGRELLAKIKNDRKIIAAVLFGSFLSQGRYNDVDICLVLDKNYSNHIHFNKRLEYLKIAKEKIDIQIFQALPLYVKIEILRHGKVILCKDMKKLYEMALAAIKEFEFFRAR